MCPLAFGQRVLVADPGHQVAQASYPGSGFFWIWRHQVKGLHVVSMVHSETAGWVEAAICVPMEDVGLTALCHFVQRINGDWGSGKKKSISLLSKLHINDFLLSSTLK